MDELEGVPGLHPRVRMAAASIPQRGIDGDGKDSEQLHCGRKKTKANFAKTPLVFWDLLEILKTELNFKSLLSFGRYLKFQSNSKLAENI